MLVFIDDSGCGGFKLDNGSSKFFVINAVIFDDDLEAEKTAIAIKELRRKLFKRDDVEFKFNKSSKKIRKNFLECVTKFDFRIRCVVVDKNILYSPELKGDKNSFYSYMIKTMLKHNNQTIFNAKIRIDGSGDRIFRKRFISYLRKELNRKDRKILQNCKLVDSKSDVLIQIADMIAGSIHRSYQKDKTDSKVYKDIIRKHLQDEWNFR